MSTPISRDAQYLALDNELRDLKQQRAKTRPAVYILLILVFGFGGLLLPSALALFAWLFAAASMLATVGSVVKLVRLNRQIIDVEAKKAALQTGA